MSDRILADREKALEDLFFEKENRKLVEKLQAEREARSHRDGLSTMTGIKDEPLLEKLVSLELRPGTWAALALIPLVEVAWADGNVDKKERAAVLAAAEANGVLQGSAAFELLSSWLDARPTTGYLEVWGESIVELCAHLDPSHRGAMKREVLARAERVAKAAGGLLGFTGRVSDAERRVLDEIGKAFD